MNEQSYSEWLHSTHLWVDTNTGTVTVGCDAYTREHAHRWAREQQWLLGARWDTSDNESPPYCVLPKGVDLGSVLRDICEETGLSEERVLVL